MSKIRVLSDHVANQIAAGEVVERPASVAKELVENSIDAGARRVEIDVEAGGRRLLRVADDGCGMTRDDAVLAFERHATSKLATTEDLSRISTLGFRGEALASIASVARVELITQTLDETEGTRVIIEGGRMRDVSPAARAVGTTIAARDLFFNVPARRKFLRSEATESFHLTNLVTHYALAHPEIEFTLTNNGREVLSATPAADLRERAYQIFGAEFIEHLLEIEGGRADVARVRGYVSAPRERRTTRDAQYLFVNGRYVRDRLVARALSEGYRSVLPHGVFPAALLFLEVSPEELDVNVHPAKTEVRFRRASAVADSVRDAVRAALAVNGFLRLEEDSAEPRAADDSGVDTETSFDERAGEGAVHDFRVAGDEGATRQEAIEFGHAPPAEDSPWPDERGNGGESSGASRPNADSQNHSAPALEANAPSAEATPRSRREPSSPEIETREASRDSEFEEATASARSAATSARVESVGLPPLDSAAKLVRDAAPESLTPDIRPLGQLEDSFIIATDSEGLLLIDQHVAHERILFDKYRRIESQRTAESQQLLVPETFDLTPAQAAAFDEVSEELERLGFGLMRLSGRTVAVRAVPADLPASEARNLLAEILDTVDAEKRGRARATLRDAVAASLASRAAIKNNTPLTEEKMRWLIGRLLLTSSPTTSPHGRPIILRLTKRDIERGFRRP
ncbi:MAG TPA: DNA mismatch repair endonuclease MutL [Pyrinomonadaceae bacterium]|nr:DNA mismatch repair endonuclease MutL [Pyrinomonadaceae bacterium]